MNLNDFFYLFANLMFCFWALTVIVWNIHKKEQWKEKTFEKVETAWFAMLVWPITLVVFFLFITWTIINSLKRKW